MSAKARFVKKARCKLSVCSLCSFVSALNCSIHPEKNYFLSLQHSSKSPKIHLPKICKTLRWSGVCVFLHFYLHLKHSFSCVQYYQFSNFLNLTFREFSRRPLEGLALVQFVLLCTSALHQKYFSIAVETSH